MLYMLGLSALALRALGPGLAQGDVARVWNSVISTNIY